MDMQYNFFFFFFSLLFLLNKEKKILYTKRSANFTYTARFLNLHSDDSLNVSALGSKKKTPLCVSLSFVRFYLFVCSFFLLFFLLLSNAIPFCHSLFFFHFFSFAFLFFVLRMLSAIRKRATHSLFFILQLLVYIAYSFPLFSFRFIIFILGFKCLFFVVYIQLGIDVMDWQVEVDSRPVYTLVQL